MDTLLSMVRRFVGSIRRLESQRATLHEQIGRAKRMFEADQKHIHHRLLALGFSHRNAVLVLCALALGLASIALLLVLAHYRNAGIIVIAIGLATYIGLRKLGYEEIALFRSVTLLRWYESRTFNRRFFLGFVDMTLITVAYGGAFVLKYELPWSPELKAWYIGTFPPRQHSSMALDVVGSLCCANCCRIPVLDSVPLAFLTTILDCRARESMAYPFVALARHQRYTLAVHKQ